MSLISELITRKKNGENISLFLKNNTELSEFEKISIQYELQSGEYIQGYFSNYDEKYKILSQYLYSFRKILNDLYNKEKIYLLDAGSGESTTILFILNNLDYYPNLHIIQYESSFSRLLLGKDFLTKNIKYNYDIEFINGNLEELPFGDNSIDIIFTSHAIEPNGKNLKSILEEFTRVCSNTFLLFEPSYNSNSDEGKKRMDNFNFFKDYQMLEYFENKNIKLLESELLEYNVNKLNPTKKFVLKKNIDIPTDFKLVCPKFKDCLLNKNDYLISKDNYLTYFIIKNIKILISQKSIFTTKL